MVGKRGPAPQPTALKLLKGETRASRLNTDAPKPIKVNPIPPTDLGPRAREVWDRQLASMAASGWLTPVDGDALRAYCEAVERYEEGARLLRGSGPLVMGARGTKERPEYVRNPLHQVVRDNAMLIRLFARDLGFVPSGREGLHPGGIEGEGDAFDAWEAGLG